MNFSAGPETSRPILRSLHPSDCSQVAGIHLQSFPTSALTRLGREAVRRYYLWQLEGPHDCLALGAFQKDQMVGFVFGGVFRGALSGFVRRNRSYLIGQVLIHPWLAFSPIFLERLKLGIRVSGFRKAAAPKAKGQPIPPVKSFGILAIAIDPVCQRGGIGKLLMDSAEQKARAGGFDRMHLTVLPSNEKAIRFYEKIGWSRVMKEGERWSGSLVKDLR